MYHETKWAQEANAMATPHSCARRAKKLDVMKTNYLNSIAIISILLFLVACRSNNTLLSSTQMYKLQFYYDISKVDESIHYISLPVKWNQISKQVVIPSSDFYVLIDSNKEFDIRNFENMLFNTLVSGKVTNLDSITFFKLNDYFISINDAKLWKKVNTEKSFFRSKSKLSPFRIENIENTINPTYMDRCIIHNLFTNFYRVRLDDETGFLFGNWRDDNYNSLW